MKKVLFVQLAIPRINSLEYKANVPLAAGYLKAYFDANFPQKFSLDILPRIFTDLLNTDAIISEILRRSPDILAFSLYLWNIEKSLYIAEKIKEKSPDIDIIFGGPEVNEDNHYLLNNPIFEKGISGEGEIGFMAYLIGKEKSKIKGFIDKTEYSNFSHKNLEDFRCEYNPYLQNIIEKNHDKTMYFETVRGCPFSCRFCYYNKQYDKLIKIPPQCIKNLYEKAINEGYEEIFLLDPSFNVQPGFSDIIKLLKDLNKDKKIEFITELRADLLTKEEIKNLSEMNLKDVEIGLQSTNPKALEAMNRKQDLAKFAENATFMQSMGINCKVDLIVGLPGDDLEHFKRSVDWVKEKGLDRDAQVFNLSILSGTDFSKNAKELGLSYQMKPPYYLLSHSTFTNEDIYEAFQYASEVFDIQFDPVSEPLLSKNYSSLNQEDFLELKTDVDYYQKIIFNTFDKDIDVFIDKLTESLTIHYIISDFERDFSKIEKICEKITKALPFNTFEFVFEINCKPDFQRFMNIFKYLNINVNHFVNYDVEPYIGKNNIISTRVVLILSDEFLGRELVEQFEDDFDVYYKFSAKKLRKLEKHVEEGYNMFIVGENQEEVFDFLLQNDMLYDNIIFDKYLLEFKKLNILNEKISYFMPKCLDL